MKPQHRLVALAFAVVAALPLAADWKKPYFGGTPAGSWAVYADTTPDTKNETTMTRVGENEIDLLMVFEANKYPPVHNRYTLPKTFAFDRKLVDYMSFIDGGALYTSETESMELDAATVEAITKNAPQYEPTAKFKGTETIDGRKADRYTYTVRFKSQHESVPSTTETGDIWLSAEVPFGVVKQKSVTKDDAGNVTMTFERVLVEAGTKK